jgi:NAD(P)-dependent dehydrogenase (short-subunit alcohol dehydrogenase family)
VVQLTRTLQKFAGRPGPSGFGSRSTAEEVTAGIDLSGRTVLVTGCASGLGLETVRVLALRGARVLAAARSEDKAREATRAFGPNVIPIACDLGEPASVQACVAKLADAGETLDVIVCNAGIMALPERELLHGYEKQFFTNHIGHFMLVTGLLDRLSARARVVVLSSGAHTFAPPAGIEFDNLDARRDYRPFRAYGQSKLANLLFAKELARRFGNSGKTANAVHPGVINTNLSRSMSAFARASMSLAAPLFFKSIPQGAATQCYVATHPSLEGVSGEYFADCNVARSSRLSRDPELATRLWERSERIVAELLGGSARQ